MEFYSLLGTGLGIIVLLGGAVMAGLSPGDLVSGSALLLVGGGTAAALLLSFSAQELREAWSLLPMVYRKVEQDLGSLIEEVVRIAEISRKEGVLAIEPHWEAIEDPLFKKATRFVIDGFDAGALKEMIESEISVAYEKDLAAADVLEAAGKSAVRLGFLGAVVGLIPAMKVLADFSKAGPAIAVALLSLVYGFGAAYLILLPAGRKLRSRAAQARVAKEVVKFGVVGIQEGLNPNFLRERLEVFLFADRNAGSLD